MVEFLWSSAVQTTCTYCRSILVRHDVDLERVGVVGDLPLDSSPIQRGSEGRYQRVGFTVVGRIIYEHERGAWNEWHLRFADGRSGWLSDAQLEYAISFPVADPPRLLPADRIRVGNPLRVGETALAVTSLTKASYRGVEGELPFVYWDKRTVLFADLRGPDREFATIDYSEEPPLLFFGEFVDFDALQLVELRQFEGWPAPR